MVRGVITRFASAAGALATAVVVAVGVLPAAAAHAAPAKPTALTITGEGVTGKLTIQQQQRPDVFNLLLNEVNWLASAAPQTSAPKADKRGPKFVLTLLVKNAPHQVYELYPLAAGGPRAHRPGKQPGGGKKADGWFYGRLTMPESLRVSGVPLEPRTHVVSGGIGGGIAEENVEVQEIDAAAGMRDFVDQMRRLVLLNGAVLVIILFGLAGISYLIRRRV